MQTRVLISAYYITLYKLLKKFLKTRKTIKNTIFFQDFTQFDINEGKLSYHQNINVSSNSDQILLSDKFVCDVTVRKIGATLSNVTVPIKIIPTLIPLRYFIKLYLKFNFVVCRRILHK